MSNYAYIALDGDRNPIHGNTEQNNRADVITYITRQGLRPISIKETRGRGHKLTLSSLNNISLGGGPSVKSNDLVVFTRQLSVMVSAGVPILKGLSSLQKHSESVGIRTVLAGVIKNVEGGMTLSKALQGYPKVFDEVYVNMVQAGEAAGILDEMLRRLAGQQEKKSSLRKKIRGAMAYPMVLVVVVVLAFFGLMLFVIPQIGNIVKDLGGPDAKLPALTIAMLTISHFVVSYWFIIIPGIIAIVAGIIAYIRTPGGKMVYDRLLLNLPVIRGVTTKLAVSRFTRTFAALIGAGVSVTESLAVASRSTNNSVYEQAIKKSITRVKNGKPLSEAVDDKLFPPIVAQMLSVGEETGQTDTVIVKIADFYEEELDTMIASLSSIIEPVMILLLGSMVGLIAASVMLPIAGLAHQIH